MNAPNIDPQVLARIQKLMALTTERGASEAEAAVAAGHVQRLLAEHNLSMAAVEASGQSAGPGGQRTKTEVKRRQVYKWQRQLMSAVANLNFCLALEKFQYKENTSPTFDGYQLIGRVDNVASARVMFEYLLQVIERLARADANDDPTQFFTRSAHSFKEGCAVRLVERLERRRREIIEEQAKAAREQAATARHPGAAPGTALIVLSDVIQSEADYNNDMRYGYELGTTARRRAERKAQEAEYERRYNEALAMGLDHSAAYYYGQGHSRERAEELARPVDEPVRKPETEAQRRKREEREEKANKRWWEQRRRQQEREHNRLDRAAYSRGHEAGGDVSLDKQVDGRGTTKIGGR